MTQLILFPSIDLNLSSVRSVGSNLNWYIKDYEQTVFVKQRLAADELVSAIDCILSILTAKLSKKNLKLNEYAIGEKIS